MTILAENKKAWHDYEILEKYEAGLVLSGPEVKSIRNGRINLKGSYAMVDKNSQLWLLNCHIAPYPQAAGIQKNYNPLREKKLLLRKKEISSLIGTLQQKGLTAAPLKVYTKNGLIKIEIGIGKGRKKWDKKELLKKREIERKIKQTLKEY